MQTMVKSYLVMCYFKLQQLDVGDVVSMCNGKSFNAKSFNAVWFSMLFVNACPVVKA